MKVHCDMNDKGLSNMRMGMNLPSGSKPYDKKLFEIIKDLCEEEAERTGIIIDHNRMVKCTELREHMPQEDLKELASQMSGFEPDGGVASIRLRDGRRLPIGAFENKKQGDFKPQNSGNAVERTVKNFGMIQCWTAYEDICPFLVYCWGSDFLPGKTIADRLLPITGFRTYNHVWLSKTRIGIGGGSVFTSVMPFEGNVIMNSSRLLLSSNIDYYLKKYGRDVLTQ